MRLSKLHCIGLPALREARVTKHEAPDAVQEKRQAVNIIYNDQVLIIFIYLSPVEKEREEVEPDLCLGGEIVAQMCKLRVYYCISIVQQLSTSDL